MLVAFPIYAKDFTKEDLTALIQSDYPGSAISDFSVVGGLQYGDGNASTAGRCIFDVSYAQSSSNELPPRLVVKVARVGATPEHEMLYRNVLEFYRHLRPLLNIETPKSFGTFYDAESSTFG